MLHTSPYSAVDTAGFREQQCKQILISQPIPVISEKLLLPPCDRQTRQSLPLVMVAKGGGRHDRAQWTRWDSPSLISAQQSDHQKQAQTQGKWPWTTRLVAVPTFQHFHFKLSINFLEHIWCSQHSGPEPRTIMETLVTSRTIILVTFLGLECVRVSCYIQNVLSSHCKAGSRHI